MKATLTCPKCGHEQEGNIPEDKCLQFYRCLGCEKLITAKKKCCVFCEYGDRDCPVSE